MFNRSRLITNPNPGTNSFPFGTEGGGVFCVVPAAGATATGAVGVWEVSVFGVDAGGGGASAATGGGSAAAGGGSGAGGGGSCTGGGGATGLEGLTGLDMLVGFVAFFSHVFVVSIQDPSSGCPYGFGHVEICCCVIDPTYPL